MMHDREKVIVEIEDALSGNLAKAGHVYKLSLNGLKDKALIDALALLKEQEAKEGHWIVLEFCANEGIYCSECHMKIFDRITKPKKKLSQYCPHCGSRNEQFFRDDKVVFR